MRPGKVHLQPAGDWKTACGFNASYEATVQLIASCAYPGTEHYLRIVDENYTLAKKVTCGTCKRTHVWQKATSRDRRKPTE